MDPLSMYSSGTGLTPVDPTIPPLWAPPSFSTRSNPIMLMTMQIDNLFGLPEPQNASAQRTFDGGPFHYGTHSYFSTLYSTTTITFLFVLGLEIGPHNNNHLNILSHSYSQWFHFLFASFRFQSEDF